MLSLTNPDVMPTISPFPPRFRKARWAVLFGFFLAVASLSANDSGTLRDASGAIMRDAPIVLGKQLPGALATATDPASWTTLKNEGFNTVRVCWVDPWYVDRNWPHWTVDEVLPHLDVLVQRARESGLNLIINYHNVGGQNEMIDFTLLSKFWQAVAPCYADEPNVYYEITNEPTFNGSRYLISEFRSGLLAIYEQVRREAPDRQVLIL